MNLYDYPDKYLDASTLHNLTKILNEYSPQRFVEVGSGVNTALLSSFNPERFVSISVDDSRIKRAKQIIGSLDLVHPKYLLVKTATINLNCCTRVPILRIKSHLLDCNNKFDFCFINGPDKKSSRAGILMNLEPRFDKGCIIVMNDFRQKTISRSIELWKKNMKEKNLSREIIHLSTIDTPQKMAIFQIS